MTLAYLYDANGLPMTVYYNDTTYYYVLNAQGDVTAILNRKGEAIVQYTYDAWGNTLSVTGSWANSLGKYNPLRYRGYVYDHETGLYYLQSRYYNPKVGRFLNGDAYMSTGQGILGNNMFAYCQNNPVLYADHAGFFASGDDGDPFTTYKSFDTSDYGGGAGVALATVILGTQIDWGPNISEIVGKTYSEIYALSKSLKKKALSIYDDLQPRVHHIVPHGEFSNRDPFIQDIVKDMQNILKKAGINPKRDPLNLTIVSQGYHKSLHTDLYLLDVYYALNEVRGNPLAVRLRLVMLGIFIRASDPHPLY